MLNPSQQARESPPRGNAEVVAVSPASQVQSGSDLQTTGQHPHRFPLRGVVMTRRVDPRDVTFWRIAAGVGFRKLGSRKQQSPGKFGQSRRCRHTVRFLVWSPAQKGTRSNATSHHRTRSATGRGPDQPNQIETGEQTMRFTKPDFRRSIRTPSSQAADGADAASWRCTGSRTASGRRG